MRCRSSLLALLATALSSAAQSCTTFVYCSLGEAFSGADFTSSKNETCADACGGNCCIGNNVCEKGRFAVCADDDDGSCNGTEACDSVGAAGNYTDGVVLISGGSCVGPQACKDLGRDEGSVLSVSNSCIGESACVEVGAIGGKVGDITNSCEGAWACASAGYRGGKVGDIYNSCEGPLACADTGGYEGIVGNIVNSCICTETEEAETACYTLGRDGGMVGDISNSCVGNTACYGLASEGGKIGNISNSCHGLVSCDGFAKENSNNMLSLDNCCIGDWVCTGLEYGDSNSPFYEPLKPLLMCPSLVEPGNCTAALTYEDCGNVSKSMGYKWIENPVPIQDKLIPHMPGGCFAKRKNTKDEIVKVRYNLNGDPGTNCGATTKDGKFTKLCVCGGVM